MDMARVVMQVFDVTKTAQSEIEKVAQALVDKYPEKEILIVLNKNDVENLNFSEVMIQSYYIDLRQHPTQNRSTFFFAGRIIFFMYSLL